METALEVAACIFAILPLYLTFYYFLTQDLAAPDVKYYAPFRKAARAEALVLAAELRKRGTPTDLLCAAMLEDSNLGPLILDRVEALMQKQEPTNADPTL